MRNRCLILVIAFCTTSDSSASTGISTVQTERFSISGQLFLGDRRRTHELTSGVVLLLQSSTLLFL